MIKFLYSTDWHAKGKNPSTRIDDFPSTIAAKIKYFFELGHDLGVDAFLCGGDYFDSPFSSSAYVTSIGKLIQQEIKDKKLYGVWGNHDVAAWNPKTVKNTPIGVFQSFSGFFEILDREPIIFEAQNGEKVKLSGVSSYARLDKHITDDDDNILEHRSRDYVIEDTGGIPQIHIVHGYLSPKPILENIHHTVISEIEDTKAAVTLTGHEHTGFPVTKLKHGLVYNPGALGRVNASHTEMNRMPMFALITIHSDGTPEIEPIQVRIAKKGSEVMDRSALDAKKAKDEMLKEAKGTIRETLQKLNIKSMDLRQLVYKYKDDVEPDVFEEIEKRLKF